MSERARNRTSRAKIAKLVIGLTIVGLLVLYFPFPLRTQHRMKKHASPSVTTNNRVPITIKKGGQHGDFISLDLENSLGGAEKMYVYRVHARDFSQTSEAASFAAEVNRLKQEISQRNASGDKAPIKGYKNCSSKGKTEVNCEWRNEDGTENGYYDDHRNSLSSGSYEILHEREDEEHEAYGGHELGKEDDEDYYKKLRIRSPLQWTEHRGPPNKHLPPKTYSDPKVIQQTADKNPHTSMNLGIPRPKPSAQTHTPKVNVDPSKPPMAASRRLERFSRSVRTFGDNEAQLVHSESTSNLIIPQIHKTIPVFPDKNNTEISPSEPRQLVCDCGPRICDNHRSLCKRWKQVPDRKRSEEASISIPEVDRGLGSDDVASAQSLAIPNEETQSPQEEPTFPTGQSSATDSASDPITDAVSEVSPITDSIPGPTEDPASGKTHYIPPYWRNDGHEDPTSHGENITHSNKHLPNSKNGTHPNPPVAPGRGFDEVLVPKKCTGTTKQRRQCEAAHIAGIMLYTLLGIFTTCIFLLVVFKRCMSLRKKRDVAAWRRRRLAEKSASTQPSSAGDSLSSKPGQQMEGGGNRPHMNMDGAGDCWDLPQRQRRTTWNIFSRNRRVPGRFSPVPQKRAPRIPTLKLPKPVFLTVRKVSGLGTEGIAASFKNKLQGKTTDISRVKWTSTV